MIPNYYVLLIVLSINLISHFFLFILNHLKNEFDNHVLFKIVSYFILLNLNILVVSILLFYFKIFSTFILYSYLTITLFLFVMHFIFDEDFFFRFEKVVVLAMMVFISIFFYGTWYLLFIL